MRYIEWGFLFLLSGLGIGLANLVGFQVNFLDSLPGILILLAISCVGVVVSKLIPLKLPIVAYVSILGLLAASPISLPQSITNQIRFAPVHFVFAIHSETIFGIRHA